MFHDWKESRFDSMGELNGRQTCIQHWSCRSCKETIALPLGVKPGDYDTTRCKKENVFRSDPETKSPWKHPIKGVRT